MVLISELRASAFELRWHEAVAVVSAITGVLMARGQSTVPAPERIELFGDGRLRVPEQDARDADPGKGLSGLLDLLLSSVACPPELRQVIADGMADPPVYPTVEAFANALAFFERPGRPELVQGVAARASDAALQASADTELERLEARTRGRRREPDDRPEQSSALDRRVLFLSAGLIVVFFLGVGAVRILRPATETRATIAERLLERVDRIAQKGLEAMGVSTPSAPPSITPPLPLLELPRVVSKGSRHVPHAIPMALPVKALSGGLISFAPVPLAANAPPEPIVRDDTVYASGAEGVEPAVLVRPQLPTRVPSATSLDGLSILEIVVSPTGSVERVRLISTANRYHDRMLVAAAKAWVFAPATKGGRAVRYRIEIPLTL